jgi:limonene-1,2-epoxide hydrolase
LHLHGGGARLAAMETQVQTRAVQSPIEVVEAFLAAGRAKDLERALSLLHDDVVYQNVPFPADRGKAATERTLKLFFRIPGKFDIKVHNIAEHGNVVLTERTDSLSSAWCEFAFWVCGTFEVRGGKIVLWRDHFDVGGLALNALAGPVRALFRALEPKSSTVTH